MTVAARKRQTGLADLGIPLALSPMEAKLVSELPKDAGWQFEPKWDGIRCLAFRAGDDVEIKAKSGKSLCSGLRRGRRVEHKRLLWQEPQAAAS